MVCSGRIKINFGGEKKLIQNSLTGVCIVGVCVCVCARVEYTNELLNRFYNAFMMNDNFSTMGEGAK